MKGRRGLAKRVLFSVCTAGLVLIGLELAGRALHAVFPNLRWAQRQAQIRAVGFPAVDQLLMPDAELFWRLRPSLEGVQVAGKVGESELAFSVTTDADGERVGGRVGDAASGVVFLGDSCTFGLGVDDRDTFPSIVSRQFPDVDCVNAGCIGYSAFQGGRLLVARGAAWKPDVVVITFGVNADLSWDALGDAEHARRRDEEASRWVNRSGLLRLARAALGGGSEPPAPAKREEPSRPRLTDAEFETEVRGMLDWCRANEARPILVSWPYRGQLGPTPTTTKQQIVARVAQEEDTLHLDLLAVFREHGSPSLFVDGVHASPRGTALVAQSLLPLLKTALGRP